MSKVLVLYSGGLDSTVVLAKAIADPLNREVETLTFDYGQSNSTEFLKAYALSMDWGFKFNKMILHGLGTDANVEIPARNTVFLAYALKFALENKFNTVQVGFEPDSTYVDSSWGYFELQRKLFELHGIRLEAPIKHYENKAQTLREALDLGVPLRYIHSCRNKEVCFECKTCKLLMKSLRSIIKFDNIELFFKSVIDNKAYGKGFNISTSESGSFKYLPALFEATRLQDLRGMTVYTTGNWGKSLEIAKNKYGLQCQLKINITADLKELRSNMLNTNTKLGEWGTRQALSTLPRPRYMNGKTINCPVVQGNLMASLVSLGYRIGNDITLITEEK